MMKKNKHVVALLLALVLAGHMITGCADADNKNQQPKTTLRFMWWGGRERYEKTLEVIKAYEAVHPEIVIEPESIEWSEYFDTLSTYAATGSMPDIVQMDYMYLSTFRGNSSLSDLTSFVANEVIDISDIDLSLIKTGLISGEVIGIPVSTSMLSVVYSKKVFDEAGLSYPSSEWTWDDFSDICTLIKTKTGKVGAAMSPLSDVNILNYFARQHGELLFTDNGAALGISEATLAEYMSLWKNLVEKEALTNPSDYEELLSASPEQMPVVQDEAGLMFEWSNFISKVSDANDNLGMVTPPLLNENNESKGLWNKPGMFLCIAETSEVKEEAAEFINWFINSEEAGLIMQGERGIPANMKVRDMLIGSDNLSQGQKQSFEYISNAYNYIGDTVAHDPVGISEINELFKTLMEKVLYDQLTPEAAAHQFVVKANKILIENNKVY